MLIWFQSTPVIADGRIVRIFDSGVKDMKFQSTPVIADGRIPACAGGVELPQRFNPRPSLLTGESLARRGELPEGFVVSIHARHC